MSFLTVNFQKQETILQSFHRMAEKILNDIQMKINGARCRIVAVALYTYSDAMPDPHKYKSRRQLQGRLGS